MAGRYKEPVKRKLSEAIREGAKLHGQAFGDYRDDEGNTCALGAAASTVLVGWEDQDMRWHEKVADELVKIWPELETAVAPDKRPKELQDRGRAGHYLKWVIADLNDILGWTRERIADWVESIGY